MDGDGIVHLGAVAGTLAGVIADPAMDGGQGVLFDQGLPGRLEAARFGEGKPGLDILTGRTGVIAGGQGRLPDGQPGADRARSRLLGEIRLWGHIQLFAHTLLSSLLGNRPHPNALDTVLPGQTVAGEGRSESVRNWKLAR
ncbi:hypothetical protein D3C87_1153740 [compost metagenome]